MKTAAQEWIEEALQEGIQKGEAIGIQKGEAIGAQKAQRQTILQILGYRFAPAPETNTQLSAQLEQIADEKTLAILVNDALQVIHLSDFTLRLQQRLATVASTPATPAQGGG